MSTKLTVNLVRGKAHKVIPEKFWSIVLAIALNFLLVSIFPS